MARKKNNKTTTVTTVPKHSDDQRSTSTSTKRGRNKNETVASRKKNKESLPSYDNHQLIDDLLNDVDDGIQVSNHESNGVGRVAETESVQSPIVYSKASTPDSFVSSHQDALLTTLPRPSPAPESTRSSTPTDFFHSHRAASRSSLTAAPFKSLPFSESRSTFQGIPDPNNVVVPSPFNEMTTYQLCSWLCANPNVLQLANNMHLSMQVLIANGGQLALSSNSSNLSNMSQSQDDKVSAIQDLVRQIFKYDLNSAEGIECVRIANKNFGDSRNKLVNGIMELIKLFKEQRSRIATDPLQKDEIITFVDESVTIQVLSRWLNATNMAELRARHSLPHLRRFVQHAFVVNYEKRNIEGTKTLDKLTKTIAVPSQNGKNFASNLQF
ncbi:unnamed protein product [Rhizophagus irregularis]|nr:unnamed protein product [Rhizophagus irregularis]